MANYREVYESLGLYALAVAGVLLVLVLPLRKLMHLDRFGDRETAAADGER